jgi:hypothetical protein
MILIQQLRDQAFIIYINQSKILGESYPGYSDILGKTFDMDFLISSPTNLIEDAKLEIQRLTKEIKTLNEGETLYLQQIEVLKKESNLLEEEKSAPKSNTKGPTKSARKGKSKSNSSSLSFSIPSVAYSSLEIL